ncbi:MAG: VOC family protein [Candidatus Sericytochromatia bacterium]|nr:VOC family protein [Candidatus Sericytochromatia bacterium]
MTVSTLHTMIRVRSLDAAQAFYEAAFGYATRARRPGPEGTEIAFLRLPDEAVELQLCEVLDEPPVSPQPRAMHLAYRVADLAAAITRAVDAGAVLARGPYTLPSGSQVAFLADPDGHAIELVQKPH